MLLLRLAGFGAFGLSACALLMSAQDWAFLPAAISLSATGAAFLGADRALDVLGQIRDRLPAPAEPALAEPAAFTGTVRSAEEIGADIARLKG